jgi:hypothetical protein
VDEFDTRPELLTPDIRFDASLWFDYFDEDASRALNKEEVVRALIKTLDVGINNQAVATVIRATIEAVWLVFDHDNSGEIDRKEFLEPKTGLADTIIASLSKLKR